MLTLQRMPYDLDAAKAVLEQHIAETKSEENPVELRKASDGLVRAMGELSRLHPVPGTCQRQKNLEASGVDLYLGKNLAVTVGTNGVGEFAYWPHWEDAPADGLCVPGLRFNATSGELESNIKDGTAPMPVAEHVLHFLIGRAKEHPSWADSDDDRDSRKA